MMEVLREKSRSGLTFGFVMVFVILIGLTTTLSDILGSMLNLDSATMIGNTGGLTLLFVLVGLWIGYRAADDDSESMGPRVLGGLAASLVMGLVISGFIYLVGALDAAEVEIRNYFVQLSRPSVNLLLYGGRPFFGSLRNLLTVLVGGGLGGFLAVAWERISLGDRTYQAFSDPLGYLSDTSLGSRILGLPNLRWLVIGLLGLFLLITPQLLSRYWNYAMGTVGIYVLMGLGLNIVVGLAGLLDLGYVAFFAIGAYTVGLLTAPAPITLQIGFWPALIFSVVLAAMSGILLGLPVLRMRGDYLAIVTLGFGEIIRVLIKSDMMAPYLGGPQGVRNITGPQILGLSLSSEKAYLYLIFLGILITIFFTRHLQNSRVGRAWMAMREDETVAQAMGINTLYYKLMAFATGAAFAGVGGALFAARNQYTGPADHGLMVSINVLCLLIVGGMGSIPGVIVGAFVLKGLPEILRELDLYRLLVFGGLLVVMMIWRPEGLWPAPRRRLELHEDDLEIKGKPEPLVRGQSEG
jgi:ABC-type branched-subunit amino acid transport system permease subunit